MKQPPPKQAFGPTVNRVADLMAHTSGYAFKGVSRLAKDARVSPSSVSRLIHGKLNPSFLLVARITEALEQELGHRIDPRDVMAENGRFPTRFCCDVCGCSGCLPDAAHNLYGELAYPFRNIEPGQWVTSRHPNGFNLKKGG